MSRRPAPLLLTALLASAVGCAEYSLSDERAAEGDNWDTGWWNGAPMDEDVDGDFEDADDMGVEPAWWAPGGALQILDGAAGKSGTTFELRFAGDDGSGLQEVCRVESVVLAMDPTEPSDPDVTFLAWWTVELSLAGAPGCTPSSFAPPPSTSVTFQLGIGPVDPLLGPGMSRAGYPWDTWSEAVYGLYLQEDASSPLYVFGITGPDLAFDAGTPSVMVEQEPLADGTYELIPLHLIPL